MAKRKHGQRVNHQNSKDPVRVLLTGFKPYRKITLNTSETVVTALRKDDLAGLDLHTAVLPVSFKQAPRKIISLIEDVRSDIIIMLGIASKTTSLRIEKAAMNVHDRSGRNKDIPIVPEGPAAFFTNWPVKRLLTALKRAKIPASLSYHAGTYVCNYTFYSVARHLTTTNQDTLFGFVHLPCLPEEAVNLGAKNHGSMSLELAVKGVEVIIRELVKITRKMQ